MAIGLVLLAGVIALPIAFGAWLIGLVSFGSALVIYILIGWAVMAAGFLAALIGHVAGSSDVEKNVDRQSVQMKVKAPNRG